MLPNFKHNKYVRLPLIDPTMVAKLIDGIRTRRHPDKMPTLFFGLGGNVPFGSRPNLFLRVVKYIKIYINIE